jgi:hypothetical protein
MKQGMLTSNGVVYDPTLAILICSKHANPFLYKNIENLRDLYKNAKIGIIDSDSVSFDTYTKIKESFPEVDIHF